MRIIFKFSQVKNNNFRAFSFGQHYNEFEVCLNYIESYSVRRLLCGMPSNALDKIFIPLYAQISKDDPDNIINNLYNYLNELKGTKDWSDDNMLINSIIEKPVYTDRRNDRIKLILESLAEDLSKELIDPRNLSIEHIMPQTLTKDWEAMLGANAKELHERWKHTLGNLTLTGYNSEISNKPFAHKLTFLRDKSNFALNQYFRDKNAWNTAEIKNRAKYLADIAIRVWPREKIN